MGRKKKGVKEYHKKIRRRRQKGRGLAGDIPAPSLRTTAGDGVRGRRRATSFPRSDPVNLNPGKIVGNELARIGISRAYAENFAAEFPRTIHFGAPEDKREQWECVLVSNDEGKDLIMEPVADAPPSKKAPSSSNHLYNHLPLYIVTFFVQGPPHRSARTCAEKESSCPPRAG